MGEEDTGHRRSIGGHDDLMAVEESSANIAKSQSQIRNEQLSDSPPGSKRRKPSSPDGVSESTWSQTDQGATTPRPIEASVSSTSSSSSSREATADGQHFGSDVQLSKAHPGKSGRDKRNSLRQPPPATRRPSASAQPETSSITSTSGASLDKSTSNLARLPSLSSIAHDLPSTGSGFHHSQPPKGLSSPVSARSRGSISSRGSSSPRASSSSSSSSAGKRRYGSIAPETGVLSRSASQVPEFRYELVIHQQPGTAAAAGLSPPALSRLPIVPSPILQLRVTDEDGAPIDHRHVLQNLPYLVCSCSLLSADEEGTPIDFATEEQPLPSTEGRAPTRRPSQPLAMICGTRVYSSSEAVDRDGQLGIFFVFWDTSIRQEGQYRLKFSLIEALPGSPTLTSVVSEPFKVVGRSAFPGIVEIATDWTRHMHRQGLTIYLPALGTSSGLVPSNQART